MKIDDKKIIIRFAIWAKCMMIWFYLNPLQLHNLKLLINFHTTFS
jgi:hypothetical protein